MFSLKTKLRAERKGWDDIVAAIQPTDVILLDLDGVLAADADAHVQPIPRTYVERMATVARIFLVTNTPNRSRAQTCADELGIPLITSSHRKPSARILEDVPHAPNTPFIVIGDKFSTDVLFAYAIGGRSFLLKERLTHKNDRWVIKLSYVLDDALSTVLGLW
ncbi:MAG: HAD hydrolase-like protein [Candidatus Pacebacteria bacterium]|nr:HAD hydrolase-like protein [Candidatus Paceibacterota bacterium]